MRNVVYDVFVVLLNRHAAAPIVPNNKIILPSDWKYWVM
jgi:hypothetical protein